MLGPLDYIIVGFVGNNFDGSVLAALAEASEKKIIRVVDLVFVMKDSDGMIVDGEFEDQSDELRQTFGSVTREGDLPLITESDMAHIGEQMENNTAVAVLIIEHLWAKELKQALSDAGGFLLDRGRLNEAAVDSALEDLEKTTVPTKAEGVTK